MVGVEVHLELREDVVVAGRRELVLADHLEHQIHVPAAPGREPRPLPVPERTHRHRARLQEADAEAVASLVRRDGPGRDVEHAAALVPVLRREPAGHQLDAVDRLGVDDADRTLVEVLQVVRLEDLQPVEEDERLVVAAAADPEVGGVVPGGQAGEAVHRPEDVLPDLGHRLDVLPRHRVPERAPRTHERERPRGDHDLLERDDVADHRELEVQVGPGEGLHVVPHEIVVAEADRPQRVHAGGNGRKPELPVIVGFDAEARADQRDADEGHGIRRLGVDDPSAHDGLVHLSEGAPRKRQQSEP